VSPALTTFLFELANFLLLVTLLGWLLFKPVRQALEAQQAAEQQRTAVLEQREKAIADATSDLQQRRAGLEAETERLRRERLAQAETEATAVVTRARETANRERERGERMLADLERVQRDRLAAAVADAARDAVGRLLTSVGGQDLDRALAHAACRALGGIDQPGAVLVESAAALDDEIRGAITKAIGTRALSLDFRSEPALGAGLRVTTARGLIDASAAGIAAHAERLIADHLTQQDSRRADGASGSGHG
jgi:F-type H+-transporting ATPase subunit b